MKFEHLENLTPPEQFDRQGFRDSAILPEEINIKELQDKIQEVNEKIKELKEEIRISSEDDSGVPQEFLRGKGMELAEAQSELNVLSQKLNSDNPLSKENLEATLKEPSSQN